MRGAVTVLICAATFLLGEARVSNRELQDDIDKPENTPINDDPSLAATICAAKGSNGVLVANNYCNHFYKCNNGFPVAVRCPLNLLYNPRKEQCDWPEKVICGARIMPDPNIDEDNNEVAGDDDSAEKDDDVVINDDYNLAPAICAAEGSDGTLVAHRFCNRFNICFNRNPVALRCQLNLLYNPRRKRCDWPDNVICGTRVIPDPDIGDDEDNDDVAGDDDSIAGDDDSADKDDDVVINDDYNLAPAICAAEGSDGTLVAHRYCNRFNKCFNGSPVALRCQINLLYNPRNKQCDWPENVACGTRTIPNPDIGDDEDNDDVAAEDDSADKEDVGVINDDYNLAPVICAADESDGVLVAHQYCNQFNKCVHGLPVAHQCQLNLLFNPRMKRCDWPQNVDCNGRLL